MGSLIIAYFRIGSQFLFLSPRTPLSNHKRGSCQAGACRARLVSLPQIPSGVELTRSPVTSTKPIRTRFAEETPSRIASNTVTRSAWTLLLKHSGIICVSAKAQSTASRNMPGSVVWSASWSPIWRRFFEHVPIYSIQARLLNYSRERQVSHNHTPARYGIERLRLHEKIARLSVENSQNAKGHTCHVSRDRTVGLELSGSIAEPELKKELDKAYLLL
jgi:hypothetical protein